MSDMLALRRHCLNNSKVYSDVTKRWFLAWNQNKQIAYFMFFVLIPTPVLFLLAIAQICYHQGSTIRCY